MWFWWRSASRGLLFCHMFLLCLFFYTEKKNPPFVWRGPDESACYLLFDCVEFFYQTVVSGICPLKRGVPEKLVKSNKPSGSFQKANGLVYSWDCSDVSWVKNVELKPWSSVEMEARKLIWVLSLLPPLKQSFWSLLFSNVYTLCTHETLLTSVITSHMALNV